MSSGPNIETDIVIELLEIYINSILFARQLYPAGIFRQRRAYNIPVWISIFKPLNDYLAKTLRAARELKHRRKLHKVELLILKDEPETSLESYVFELEDHEFSLNTDENLLDLEEQIRKSLLNLDCRLKGLKKLPSDTTFKIMLYTTESAFAGLGNNPRMQSFPLVKETSQDLAPKLHRTNTQLLPVSHTPNVGLQLYVEEYL
ncbi:DNA polymerase zeta subunit 2 [Ochlerotatus camptorhynchus]|uniref:DNA polymerase zeta subunit 2 n=1 Tax=Ochlerotatus camptorhynchus TaxID=644619 RepID=UPI0031D320D6